MHFSLLYVISSGFRGSETRSLNCFSSKILGCTAPQVRCADVVVYIGDGRFHLEAAMIANPKLRAFKYDPYAKKLTEEFYNHERMLKTRHEAIQRAAKTDRYGLVLGTLGRQGRPNVLKTLQNRIEALGKKTVVILLSEIFPGKIELFEGIDAFIQVQSLFFVKKHFSDCSKNGKEKSSDRFDIISGSWSHCCGISD